MVEVAEDGRQMKKLLKPQTVIVSFEIEIDLNILLEEGYRANVPVPEIKKSIRRYLMDTIKTWTTVPGEEIALPDFNDIIRELSEWDMITSVCDEDE
jgi:hypothetical protein